MGLYNTKLSNGITLLVIPNPTIELIATRFYFRAGNRYELPALSGLAHLVAVMLLRGSINHSAAEIADRVEGIGASFGVDASNDVFQLGLKTVTEDFESMFGLAAEVLRYPIFPEEQIELEKRLVKQSIQSQMERPTNQAFKNLREIIYGDRPYGRSVLGTLETVDRIQRQDLVDFHDRLFRPDNLVVSIAGDITLEKARELGEKYFGDWQPPTTDLPLPDSREICWQPETRELQRDSQQTIVALGYLGVGISHPDYAALKLIATYLGNGLSSRLFVELREKRGLAYEVSASFSSKQDPAQFSTYIGTAPQNFEVAIGGLREEMDRLRTQEIDPIVLAETKSKIVGQTLLSKQSNSQIASIYGWYEILGLPADFEAQFLDRTNNLTATDIIAAADRYLQSPAISIVGNR